MKNIDIIFIKGTKINPRENLGFIYLDYKNKNIFKKEKIT